MKILIIGNEGYIGPVVVNQFKNSMNKSMVAGFDTGFFSHAITYPTSPELKIDIQYRGDVREFPPSLLNGYDSVIYLAAISNDPMGNEFEQVTMEVNQNSAIRIANLAKSAGVHHFVYASSCSVYGTADDKPRIETSTLNPLTAYARSKVGGENGLKSLASDNFIISCLRFATACGYSPRLRLDLVLNDFVASAITTSKIKILSDGSPWRPLIHINDMARAMQWASNRHIDNGGSFIILNVGSNKWNYQIKELAQAVKDHFPNLALSINENAAPDKRSYKVDFGSFKNLAKEYYPKMTLNDTVKDLSEGLNMINFNDPDFRNSYLIRLSILKNHIRDSRLNKNLFWKNK
tara:strand:+ start:4523 stop:5569 length:1047 start_codon:yes stop_codon:yes gene_type:complete